MLNDSVLKAVKTAEKRPAYTQGQSVWTLRYRILASNTHKGKEAVDTFLSTLYHMFVVFV